MPTLSKEFATHLHERNMLSHRYSFDVIDPVNEVVTYFIWNLSGQLVGYQQYRWKADKLKKNNPKEGRYFTYVSKQEKATALAIWGLQYLDPKQRTVFVTEGYWEANAVKLLGYNGLAVFGCNPKHLKGWLTSNGYGMVALVQPDSAARKLASSCDRSVVMPADFDDLSKEKQLQILLEGA